MLVYTFAMSTAQLGVWGGKVTGSWVVKDRPPCRPYYENKKALKAAGARTRIDKLTQNQQSCKPVSRRSTESAKSEHN